MIHPRCILLLATLVAASHTQAQQARVPETLRYTVMSNNTKSGAEVDTFRADDQVDSTFEFNDRGRGPKVTAHWTLNASGMPVSVDVTGVDYLKAPVDEHFSVKNGKAHWKSTSEEGEAPEGRIYTGIQTSQAEQTLLIRLLSHAGATGVPLYPSGVAHLDKMQETTVHKADGDEMHVTEYAISGFSLEPSTIWMDDHLQFFAEPGPWFAILREGWETTNDQLYQLQAKADRERYQRLAQQLTEHPARPVAIEHVRLFDAEHAAMLD